MTPAKVLITGSGLYTPPNAIDNDALVASYNAWVDAENARQQAAIDAGEREPLAHSSSEFIVKASGIQSRYVLDAEGILNPERMRPQLDERANDAPGIQCEMALAASRQALDSAGVAAADIDLVIVACSNLERAYPAVAVELQQALGAGGYAFDMNVACSSATFAIDNAVNAIRGGGVRRALVVNPEVCSAHLNFRDRDSHFIFGDACTALVLESEEVATAASSFEVVGTRLLTRFSNAIRNNAGFLNRVTDSDPLAVDKLFVQEGRRVFKDVCPMVAELIRDHLSSLQITPSSVSRLWLHQANRHMNDLIARRVLGHEPELDQAPIILDRYANTSSAGSVIAFHLHHQDLEPGAFGVVCSFGAGYSAGCVVIRRR
ncbi:MULTISPECIES: beta-ketoacyl-ACP synthase III [Halomonas]|uniref:beta-ketoacyl-ACP synthase III n=1 Tax=Halomonas TaxID=2745 RepID=UPI001C959861|nr:MULTISPECIES: beta-ketoacyl-ACP synthase III [Halomonas]MED5296705.1 beta-ketoacyl-ACP synthase III [Pseudomonadota bacterium]MBY5984915.1 beta-ketoacyl-ACP synthase III [Halomonas sp. DP5Y7-2]MBY6207973.1 beta-ketoacyl-ACP synthase III [Halomonas sp. DP3Y7-2]MBY6228782.1 beta-ketoacyl-ACP synthase III [Halomonas sp. DP3Y7-1]MCA0917234.1 beta-ketoacyl-ACP synthase III [Halomonas denitrificans]